MEGVVFLNVNVSFKYIIGYNKGIVGKKIWFDQLFTFEPTKKMDGRIMHSNGMKIKGFKHGLLKLDWIS